MRLSHAKWVSGFTLIELMVTLSVAAILLVAALPSFMDFFDKARLRGAADDLVSFFAEARTESVKRNRDISVAFGGALTAWCIGAKGAAEAANPGDVIPAASACLTSGSNCATDTASCTVAGAQKTLDGSAYSGVAVDTLPAITFDSRLGAVSSLGATIVNLTSPQGKFHLQLTVSPLGQASLCVPSGPAIPGYPSC